MKPASSYQAGWTTTLRSGSSPSDSLVSPFAATVSCTIFRSNGVIGSRRVGSPLALTSTAIDSCQGNELAPTVRAVSGDVQHQPAPLVRLPVYGETSELLQGLQHLAVVPDQILEVASDDRHHRAVTFDVEVDVAVDVGDVEKLLEIVGRDVAFSL